MKLITIKISETCSIMATESKKHRWKLTFIEDAKQSIVSGLSAARAWATIQNKAAGLSAKELDNAMKDRKEKTLLGAEWAALRISQGSRPLICPLRKTGLWLYIERTGPDSYEVRVVEPLGERRTEPVVANTGPAARLLEAASARPLT